MLKLENVKKVYRKKQDEVVALDSTSVEIPRGDFCFDHRPQWQWQNDAAVNAGSDVRSFRGTDSAGRGIDLRPPRRTTGRSPSE